jgi:hypothetical protein
MQLFYYLNMLFVQMVHHMQSLTSTATADKGDPSKLPAWDKTKNIYKMVSKFLKRPPRQTDSIPKLLKNKKKLFSELVEQTGESRNNANKYFCAASMGPEFMQLYDEVNTLHMQCTYLIFSVF